MLSAVRVVHNKDIHMTIDFDRSRHYSAWRLRLQKIGLGMFDPHTKILQLGEHGFYAAGIRPPRLLLIIGRPGMHEEGSALRGQALCNSEADTGTPAHTRNQCNATPQREEVRCLLFHHEFPK